MDWGPVLRQLQSNFAIKTNTNTNTGSNTNHPLVVFESSVMEVGLWMLLLRTKNNRMDSLMFPSAP